jgi:hypothetical protein
MPPEPGESKEAGCALCGSSWGNWWEEVEGRRLFFCCSLCAAAYKGAVRHVELATGWDRVDSLFLDDVRGNEADGHARRGDQRVRFWLTGEDDGTITKLELR